MRIGILGLGDLGGTTPNYTTMEIYGPVGGQYVSLEAFQAWQVQQTAANAAALAANQAAANKAAAAGQTTAITPVNPVTVCPAGYHWDGVNGLSGLAACMPVSGSGGTTPDNSAVNNAVNAIAGLPTSYLIGGAAVLAFLLFKGK